LAEANPQQAQALYAEAQQQIVAQVQPQIEKLEQTPTVEKVARFLKDERIRPFVLDIETDSTIQPDEDAEKQRRNEFLAALGTSLQQLGQLVAASPAAAPFAAEILKFAVAPYRAGRELEAAIEEFADRMVQQASQPQPNPEAEKAKAEAAAKDKELALKERELQIKEQAEAAKIEAERENAMAERQAKKDENNAKLQVLGAQMQRDEKKGEMEMRKLALEIEAKERELAIREREAQIDAAVQVQSASIAARSAEQQSQQRQQQFEQQSALNAQKAAQPPAGA